MIAGTRNKVGGVEAFLIRRSHGLAAARRCPSCGEELSDRFGFCPLDGTPLGATADLKAVEGENFLRGPAGLESEAGLIPRGAKHSDGFLRLDLSPPVKRGRSGAPRRGAERDSFHLTVIEHRALPVRLLAALFEAARARPVSKQSVGQSPGLRPDARAAGTGGQTDQIPGELSFTIPEDAGLLRRLARELSAFAQDSRLTWPEFRRDPSGFIRRAVDALDKLGLIPISRRYKTTSSPPRRTDDPSGG